MLPDSLIAWVKITYNTILRTCILEAQDAAAASSRDIHTYFNKKPASQCIRRKLPHHPKGSLREHYLNLQFHCLQSPINDPTDLLTHLDSGP